jgi:hypothetical protein
MDPAGLHPGAREDAIMTWVPLVRRIASGEFRRLGSLTKLLIDGRNWNTTEPKVACVMSMR